MVQTIGRWGAATMIAAGLLFGGAMLSNTLAQTNEPSVEAPADTLQQEANVNPAKPVDGTGFGGRGPGRGGHGKQGLWGALFMHTVELTKLEAEAVKTQLEAGSTLSAIASANGSSEQAVIDAALANINERLTEAVSNGRISETEKTAQLDKAKTEAPTLMQQTGLPERGGPRGGPEGGRGRHHLVEATAETTGLTIDEVRAEVEAGKSLAQIAEANGKTADDIIANLRSKGEERLDSMLEQAREQINAVPEK